MKRIGLYRNWSRLARVLLLSANNRQRGREHAQLQLLQVLVSVSSCKLAVSDMKVFQQSHWYITVIGIEEVTIVYNVEEDSTPISSRLLFSPSPCSS